MLLFGVPSRVNRHRKHRKDTFLLASLPLFYFFLSFLHPKPNKLKDVSFFLDQSVKFPSVGCSFVCDSPHGWFAHKLNQGTTAVLICILQNVVSQFVYYDNDQKVGTRF